MNKSTSLPIIDAAVIKNNAETGGVDFEMREGDHKISFTMSAVSAISVLNLLLLRLMQRTDELTRTNLQNFAIRDIEAHRAPNGRPYLTYQLENGLVFGSGLPPEKLATLYYQLGEILGWPQPKTDGAVPN
ncbi:MAG: hypothetical protein V4858_12175 [Pseudomonadota bacterium]